LLVSVPPKTPIVAGTLGKTAVQVGWKRLPFIAINAIRQSGEIKRDGKKGRDV